MRNKKITSGKTQKIQVLFTLIIAVALLLSGCGKAQNKVYRVGILSGLDFVADITDGFKAKMTELGYVEGKNIIYDVQKTNVDFDVYRSILKKFIDDKVDLIVAFPTEASMEAKKATEGTNIPVIFAYAITEGMGLINDVRNPGGNITGVRYISIDAALKRFDILHQLAPEAKRIWVPYFTGYPIVTPQLEALRPIAAAAGVTLIESQAMTPAEVQSSLDKTLEGGEIDAILMLVEPLCVTPDDFVIMAKYAYDHKIVIGGALMAAGDYGTIFDVGVKSYDAGVLAAPLADKIFKGTPAGTIPVVSSESYMIFNLKVAQTLGITVPENLLRQANQIIK
jgi:putative tryptophan/tyrosine transport system substrate-binding protein